MFPSGLGISDIRDDKRTEALKCAGPLREKCNKSVGNSECKPKLNNIC